MIEKTGTSVFRNDEPVYEDDLYHFPLVMQLGQRIRHCDLPYVIGICGAWGSGKTSFMRKLWAYLGGPFEVDGPAQAYDSSRRAKRREWFKPDYPGEPPPPNKKNGWHLIWFNPWHHQFEQSPLVGLLHEIRQHFSLVRKTFDETGKLADVTVHSTLNMLGDMAKALKLPLPTVSTKSIMDRGREYEAEHFATDLSSQRFRDFFEEGIRHVIGPEGRIVIFIDDLDRCEGEVAYRLLESLKLYLNARNCIYVLGLDQAHLEETIARVLSGSEETWRYRPLARNYLNKMFQNLFLLPVPKSMETYVRTILDPDDHDLQALLQNRFALQAADWPHSIVTTLNQNVPHNPRKVKSFVAAWKLYLSLLANEQPAPTSLDWRLTLILNYLGQFEEPLFRKVEEGPGFYSDKIVRFCRTGSSTHPLLDGLELPTYRSRGQSPSPTTSAAATTGGLESPSPIASQQSAPDGGENARPSQLPRVFWIGDLVTAVGEVDREIVERHLLGTERPPVQALAQDGADGN